MNPTDPLAALADIETPAPPDWAPLIAIAALTLAIAAALLIFYIRTRGRPRHAAPSTAHEALARIEGLQREWEAGETDARTAAYRLATLLRLGLGLPQLRPATPPAGLDAAEWRETLTFLHGLRYAPAPVSALSPELFARARRWLGRPDTDGTGRDV
ncbi:MAG: DUF4381 family protein [Gammaproteobacteria bacterium]|nr:DUF4381 family protein [Gammaproteobacteria bacterium]